MLLVFHVVAVGCGWGWNHLEGFLSCLLSVAYCQLTLAVVVSQNTWKVSSPCGWASSYLAGWVPIIGISGASNRNCVDFHELVLRSHIIITSSVVTAQREGTLTPPATPASPPPTPKLWREACHGHFVRRACRMGCFVVSFEKCNPSLLDF